MSLTLKQILDIAIGSTGAIVPTTWIGSNNVATSNQLLAIANQSVLALRDVGWQKQTRPYSFTLTSASDTYALPSDYLNIVPDTMWIQSSIWRVDFPTDPTVWAYLKASAGPSGIVVRCRLINGFFEFYEPQDGLDVGFEYYSNAPIQGPGSSGNSDRGPKQLFTSDSDQWLLDDALIIADIKWRYKAEKGLEYQADLELFKRQMNAAMGDDKGAKTIMPWDPWNPSPQCNLWQYPE